MTAWAGWAMATACIGDVPVAPPLIDSGWTTPAPTDSGRFAPMPTEGDTEGFLGPRFASGSRLAARSIGAPKATEAVFSHFFDTEIGVTCAFATATDGVVRCLPIPDVRVAESWFTDATCETAVTVTACGDVPYTTVTVPHASEDPCDAGGDRTEVRALEPIPSPEGLFRISADGTCEPAPDASAGAVRAGEVVSPERFVGARIEERTSLQGFGVRELVADDGARLRQELFHVGGRACSMRYLEGLGPRCLPDDHAQIGAGLDIDWWWSSADCTDAPLAYRARVECPTDDPRFAIEFGPGAPRLYEVRGAYGGTFVYDGLQFCDPMPVASMPWDYWTLRPGVAGDGALPQLDLVTVPGEPVNFLRFEDAFGLWVDEGFAEGPFGRSIGGPFEGPMGPCTAYLDAEGEARCVDGDAWVEDDRSVKNYADSQCTVPLLAVFDGLDAPQVLVTISDAVCGVERPGARGVLREARSVEAPDPGPSRFVREPGTLRCVSAERDPNAVYHRLGGSVIDLIPALSVR